jgi:hypothetical protein
LHRVAGLRVRRYGPPRRRSGHQQRIAGDHVVDIFDEVDEELRAERAQQLLKRYGGLIVVAAVAIVGAVGGWQGWRWYEERQDQAAAIEYIAAMNLADATAAGSSEANRAAGIAMFTQLAAKAPAGYATLSRLREAALKADAGDLAGAAALWDQLASDSSIDPLLRDLASLLWAQHQIDSADPSLLESRLKALAAPTNAWHALADEQLALLDLRQGKMDQARTTLRRLAQDTTAPSGVRGRAGALLGRLGG